MAIEKKTCLFCQTENEFKLDIKELNGLAVQERKQFHCRHCGMELPDEHPNDRKPKMRFFIKFFWFIVIFCLFMVIYLPR